MFLCELPVGSEHAASRAKQQATVKHIYIYIYVYIYIYIWDFFFAGGKPGMVTFWV